MPDEHAQVIREVRGTVATVSTDRPLSYTEEAWQRDVVHRWAHAMQAQADASVRRWGVRVLGSGTAHVGDPT